MGAAMSIERHSWILITSSQVTPLKKRIWIVSRDRPLPQTRALLLEHAGYDVVSVETDDVAMELPAKELFNLVLLGRNTRNILTCLH
jgi:hypothetical protein